MSNIVSSPIREPLPETLKSAMAAYRLDLGPMPAGYIEFHVKLAQAEKDRLIETYRVTVLAERMVDGGWFDGMREVELVVETRKGRLLKLRWHDGNQGYMVDTGHGQCALLPADIG